MSVWNAWWIRQGLSAMHGAGRGADMHRRGLVRPPAEAAGEAEEGRRGEMVIGGQTAVSVVTRTAIPPASSSSSSAESAGVESIRTCFLTSSGTAGGSGGIVPSLHPHCRLLGDRAQPAGCVCVCGRHLVCAHSPPPPHSS